MTPARQWSPELKRRLIGKWSWRRALRSFVIIYALVVAFLYFREDALVFLPQPSSYVDAPGLLKLKTADGQRITAAYLPNAQAHYTLIYSHGNAEDVGENLPVMRHLCDLGFNVLIYDYHGYGTSTGTPGERTSEFDILAAYDYVTGVLKTPATRVIAYGRSVGSGPTLALVSQKPVGGLILESAFMDPASVRVPVRLLPWVMFPNLDRIKLLHVPVLVMHGLSDDLIPVSHGQALYAAANAPKQCLWVPGASHDDFKLVAGAGLDKALLKFLAALPTD